MMHLKKGLDLFTALPESRERLQRELDLLLLLRVVLVGVQGHSDPEVVRIVNRAHELSDQLEERPRLFSVTQSLWVVHVLRAEVPASRELAGQLFTLAQDDPDPTALFVAHQALGQSSYHGGEFELARVHFEQCIALYDPQKHRLPQAYSGVQNYAVSSHAMLAGALWMLGYPERARRQSQAAFDLAQELSHPISLAFALHWIARIQQYRQNPLAVQEAAEPLIALATEQAAKPHILRGTFYRGWALAAQGQAEAGLAEMPHSLKNWQDSGAAANVSHYLALLAALYADLLTFDTLSRNWG